MWKIILNKKILPFLCFLREKKETRTERSEHTGSIPVNFTGG